MPCALSWKKAVWCLQCFLIGLVWYREKKKKRNQWHNLGIWKGRNFFRLSPGPDRFLSISENQNELFLWESKVGRPRSLLGNRHLSGIAEGTGMSWDGSVFFTTIFFFFHVEVFGTRWYLLKQENYLRNMWLRTVLQLNFFYCYDIYFYFLINLFILTGG